MSKTAIAQTDIADVVLSKFDIPELLELGKEGNTGSVRERGEIQTHQDRRSG